MNLAANVLLFDAAPKRTESLQDRLRERGVLAVRLDLAGTAVPDQALRAADVVVIAIDHERIGQDGDRLAKLLGPLAENGVPTLLWGLPDNHRLDAALPAEHLAANVSLDEVVGRLTTMTRYAPLVRRLDRELQHMRRIGQQLQRYFDEIDKEMRLAGRLQQSFLPSLLPQMRRLQGACLYRPASWVSGDVYDVYQIDEHHVGIFLADAMGHGTAAALMTMFLRQALFANRVMGKRRRLIEPVEVMKGLNDCLIEQQLPDSQFVTAAFGIIDTASLELRLARGGHPFPLHVNNEGEIRELRQTGSLLGLADLDGAFGELRVRLEPGDKVIFYTDGAEAIFVKSRQPKPASVEFTANLHAWAKLEAPAFIEAIDRFVDRQEGSLHPVDDVTVVTLGVTS
jgi:sigma-B regulation protein RsbU (phosphoserine phosphatase)